MPVESRAEAQKDSSGSESRGAHESRNRFSLSERHIGLRARKRTMWFGSQARVVASSKRTTKSSSAASSAIARGKFR